MDNWPTPPTESDRRPYYPPSSFGPERSVPGTVTAVSVFLWIGVVFGGLVVLFLLGSMGSGGDGGILLILAAAFVANMVLNGVCAVKIRRASRPWRTVTIVLLVLTMVGGLFQLPIGLLAIGLNGLMLYLLAGTESSQRFFNNY
jgi:hypothetical protein